MKRFLPRPTYGNVLATIAIFVALGGVSYARQAGEGEFGGGTGPSSKAWTGSTYRVSKTIANNGPFEITSQSVLCDQGDRALSGGFLVSPSVGTVIRNFPFKTSGTNDSLLRQGWSVTYLNTQPNIASGAIVMVRCADFNR
jgi:hypothetical protein